MRKTVLSTVVVSGVLLAATASLAASDYYLKIEGVEGETAKRTKAETIELESWSFGARAAAAAEGDIQTITLVVPEPGNSAAAELTRMCASGKHIKTAVLSGPNGRYKLQDVVITSCVVTGNERRHEFTGHVTLMK